MIEKYLKQLKEKGYSESAQKRYKQVLSHFKEQGFTIKTIRNYQKKLIPYAMNTRINYLATLRKYLEDQDSELAEKIIIPKKITEHPKNIPSQEKVKEILQKPDITTYKGIRDKVILELIYSGGIRRQELLNLKTEDLDTKRQIIKINQGKNKKDRIIPISGQAIKWLTKYNIKIRGTWKPKTNYIFLSRQGYQMPITSLHKIIRKYGEYSCHKYRHAYATHLMRNGMKVATLQRLLGHSSIRTTQIYTQITIKELKTSHTKYHPRNKWN